MRNGGEGSGGPIAPASCTYQGLPQAKISGATQGVFPQQWLPAPFLLPVVSRPKELRDTRREGPKGGGGERGKGQDEGDGRKSGLTGFWGIKSSTVPAFLSRMSSGVFTEKNLGHVSLHPCYVWEPVKVQVEVSRKQLHIRV